jgi:hypothetical protein
MNTNASNANVGCIHGKQGKPCLNCRRDQKHWSRAQETEGAYTDTKQLSQYVLSIESGATGLQQ